MDLIQKCPVENPCEASSFDEAFHKNHVRYKFEQTLSEDLVAQLRREGKEPLEAVDPEFWKGCLRANNLGYAMLEDAMSKVRKEVAKQLADAIVRSLPREGEKTAFLAGYLDVLKTWAEALERNDPQRIVYW